MTPEEKARSHLMNYAVHRIEKRNIENSILDIERAAYAAGWQAGAEAMRDTIDDRLSKSAAHAIARKIVSCLPLPEMPRQER